MGQTLRRSCSACAKSKHRCDLLTPRCTRCVKRNVQCLYANEPLTAPSEERRLIRPPDKFNPLTSYTFGSLDPFDSYPPTRLPREQVQRLIHGFLHKIAFQYYPLDLSATSNPFLISWWPLALGDPALFHVSLQTACLDEELWAQKGFQTSELLMADSVALLRRKVQDPSLAVQDGTMNSVITLAAIEFGKGNIEISEMHVNGVKRLVSLRGGINSVRQTSPLTARMVSWVSMLIMGHPQFPTQDDLGIGEGIPPIPEWQLDPTPSLQEIPGLSYLEIDSAVKNVFVRLRAAFTAASLAPFQPTRLHDLTCFVVHRLLLSASHSDSDSIPDQTDLPSSPSPSPSPLTESIRYAIILYMLIIQGPTYYTHAVIANTLTDRFLENLTRLDSSSVPDSFLIWLIGIGMVASSGTHQYPWFVERAYHVSASIQSGSGSAWWDHILGSLKSVLWLETPHSEDIFRPHWDAVLGGAENHFPGVGVAVSVPSALPMRIGSLQLG